MESHPNTEVLEDGRELEGEWGRKEEQESSEGEGIARDGRGCKTECGIRVEMEGS